MRRRFRLLLVGVCGAAALVLGHYVDRPTLERAVTRVRGTRGGEVVVSTQVMPRHDHGSQPSSAVRVVASTHEVRDGISAFDKTLLATSGGLVMRSPGGTATVPARTLTFVDGLSTDDIRVLALWRGVVAALGGDGALILVDRTTAQVVRLGTGEPITELAADAEHLFIATPSRLLAWDGDHARAQAAISDITALAAGPYGVAIGTAGGSVLVLRHDRLTTLAVAPGRVTALTWAGPALWVGRSSRLEWMPLDGRMARVRDHIAVSAVLVDPRARRLYVGTENEGLLIIEDDGRTERRIAAPRQVLRLRTIGESVVAFGDDAAWEIRGQMSIPVPLPPSLRGAPRALAVSGGSLWVGTDAGLDRVDADHISPLSPKVRLPIPVHDLEIVGEDMWAATSQGVWRWQRGIVRCIDGTERLSVRAVAWLGGELAIATHDGLVVARADGSLRRGLRGVTAQAATWLASGRLALGTTTGVMVLSPEFDAEQEYALGPTTALVAAEGGFFAGGNELVWVAAATGMPERLGSVVGGIRALLLDGTRLYIGTSRGLLAWEVLQRRFTTMNVLLGSGAVNALAADGEALWVATESAVVRVDRTLLGPST